MTRSLIEMADDMLSAMEKDEVLSAFLSNVFG
jgi:hypothetical protein